MSADPPQDNPMWVRCKKCDHEWVGLWMPMLVEPLISIMTGMRCPKCATGPQGIFIIKPPEETT